MAIDEKVCANASELADWLDAYLAEVGFRADRCPRDPPHLVDTEWGMIQQALRRVA